MAVNESITEEEVIRIGPSNPDGWRRAAELGLLDDDYLEPVYVKPMSYKFLEGIPVSKPAQPVDPLKYHQRRARATPRWLTYAAHGNAQPLQECSRHEKKEKREGHVGRPYRPAEWLQRVRPSCPMEFASDSSERKSAEE